MKSCFLILVVVLSACSHSQKEDRNATKKYLKAFPVSRQEYVRDSLRIVQDLSSMLKKGEGVFYSYNARYVDTTKSQVLLDTVVYDSTRTRAVAIIEVKYLRRDYRKVVDGNLTKLGNKILFDGFGFLVKIKQNQFFYRHFELRFTNSENHSELKGRMVNYFFENISSDPQPSSNQYNINDSRFWNEPIWTKF